jgi:cell division protein FtsB
MPDTRNSIRNKGKAGRFIFLTVIILVAGYGLFQIGGNAIRIFRLLRMKHTEEQALIEANRKRELLLSERKRLLEDPAYIEEIARREYGMIREGEEVYHITLPDTTKQ